MKPAFVVISGDLINSYHDPRQTRDFWKIAQDIRSDIPLYRVFRVYKNKVEQEYLPLEQK